MPEEEEGANARLSFVRVGDILLLAELPRVGHSNLEGGTFNAMHVHADGTFDAQIVGASQWQRGKTRHGFLIQTLCPCQQGAMAIMIWSKR